MSKPTENAVQKLVGPKLRTVPVDVNDLRTRYCMGIFDDGNQEPVEISALQEISLCHFDYRCQL
jgi:hypothetical protein